MGVLLCAAALPTATMARVLPDGLAGLTFGLSRSEAIEHLGIDPAKAKCTQMPPHGEVCFMTTPSLEVADEHVDVVGLGWKDDHLKVVGLILFSTRKSGQSPEEAVVPGQAADGRRENHHDAFLERP